MSFIKARLQDLLAFTPFVSPTSQRFYKNADRSGLLGQNKFLRFVLAFLPPLKWLDNKFKYPFLTLGRIALYVLLLVLFSNFTLYNNSYKTLVDEKIINYYFALPIKNENTKTNFVERFNSLGDDIKNEVNFSIETAKINTFRTLTAEGFYGSLGLILRIILFYILYSLLFFIFGNTIAQKEQLALEKMRKVREVGQDFIDNFPSFLAYLPKHLLSNELRSKLATMEMDYRKTKKIKPQYIPLIKEVMQVIAR
jgi:hypothetical protein